jgi:hypothetical protein
MPADNPTRDALVVACSSGAAPEQVRSWLRSRLVLVLDDVPDEADLVEDALVCTNELLTNALQAQCSTATVRYGLSEALLRLSVYDDAGGLPQMRTPAPADTRGRGLLLVNALAHQWGVTPTVSGKEVWVELQRPEQRPEQRPVQRREFDGGSIPDQATQRG